MTATIVGGAFALAIGSGFGPTFVTRSPTLSPAASAGLLGYTNRTSTPASGSSRIGRMPRNGLTYAVDEPSRVMSANSISLSPRSTFTLTVSPAYFGPRTCCSVE